jgi:hypothetical protein
VPRVGRALRHGVLLGGFGHARELAALAAAALDRAAARDLALVLFFADARERPAWLRRRLRVAARYEVLAKSLRAGSAGPNLGGRPLWVDPRDL